MKTFQTLLLGAGLLCLASCTSQKKALNSYIGTSKQDVIAKMGTPTQITNDSNGEVLWYTTEKTIGGSAGSINWGSGDQITSTHGSQPHSYMKSIAIYINPAGKVDHWAKFQ